jgi:hypothetical protein
MPPQKQLMVVFETPLSNSYGNISCQPENGKLPTNYVKAKYKTKVDGLAQTAHFKLLRKTLVPNPQNYV